MFNDYDDAVFAIIQHRGRERIIFTTLATLKDNVPGRKPLWWLEPHTDEELVSLSVWLGENRGLWPAWREIAERDGGQALVDEIERLWSNGPLENCHSVMLSPGSDPREIALYAMLVTRNREIIRHRFATVFHRRLFTEWYLRGLSENARDLLLEGCLSGPKQLRRVLDRIARAEAADRRQARARRAARPPRRAA